MKKTIIGVVVLINLILVILVVLYVMGVLPPKKDSAVIQGQEVVPVQQSTLFYAFNPPIVVNIQDGRKLRFMQIELHLLARSQNALDPIENLEPLLRHELIMLYSAIDGKTIKTVEAKDTLRRESLALINHLLEQEGQTAEIENVLFTKMIIQ